MPNRVALTEYRTSQIKLAAEDVQEIRARLSKHITLTPSVIDGLWDINPNQFVGVVRLPSGKTLDLLPKVPLYTVMWMIAEVERLEGIDFNRLERQANIATFDDILEPIASAFVESVENLIDRGLYRTYIEQDDNLNAIRGRIDFPRDVVQNVVLRHRTWCVFTEFSWDVPENQVIRQVLRQLSGWGFSHRLTRELMALERQMEDIQSTNMRSVDMNRFTYSRQNDHYQPIHRFCRLFLDGFSLSEHAGESPFDGFLMDMNVLFERFIALKLRHHLERVSPAWRLAAQSTYPLDEHNSLRIQPDLLLDHAGTRTLVADTKYKLNPRNISDFYQIITYCTVLGLNRGMLIYPRHEKDLEQSLVVRRSGTVIEEVSVDLRESRESIENAIGAIARKITLPVASDRVDKPSVPILGGEQH